MTTRSIFVFVVAFSATICASAAEFEAGARIGWGRSDNIQRVSSGGSEVDFGIVNLLASGQRQTRRLDFGIDADVGFRFYSDVFDDDVIGEANVFLDFGIVPDVLTWRSSDSFGTIQSDPFRPYTPDNQENVNSFLTGPDLHLEFGRAMALDIGARYRSNNFQVSDIDSDVLSGSLALVRAISSNRSVSLNLSSDRVEYSNAIYGGFDRHRAYLSFSSNVSRGSLKIDVGVNEVSDEVETTDGFLGSINFERELSSRSRFSLWYDQRLSDAGDYFSRFPDQAGQLGDPREVSASASPFENRQVGLQLNHDRNISNWYVSFSANDEDYLQDSSRDRKLYTVRAGLSSTFGAGWQARIDGQLQRVELESIGREYDDLIVSLGLSKRISRALDVDISYYLADRESNEPTAEYQENMVVVTFGYSYR